DAHALLAGGGAPGPVARALEQAGRDLAAVGVVVDDQDGRRFGRGRHSETSGPSSASSTSPPRRRRSFATRVVRLSPRRRAAACLLPLVRRRASSIRRFSNSSTALLRSRPSSPSVGRGIFFSEMKERTLGGRCSISICPSSERITSRSRRFSSSRTLPGQSYSQ